jgi:hypothetical protein
MIKRFYLKSRIGMDQRMNFEFGGGYYFWFYYARVCPPPGS